MANISHALEYLEAVLLEPSLFSSGQQQKNLEQRAPKTAGARNADADQIEQLGFARPNMSEKSIEMVRRMGRRFDRLLKKGTFHYPPDEGRPNTASYGTSLFCFNRLWSRWFPEAAIVIEKELGETLRAYFGQDYVIRGMEVDRKKYIADDCPIPDAYSNYWHFDWRRGDTEWLLVLFNLNDQAKEAGFHSFDLETSNMALEKGLHGRYAPDELPPELQERAIVTGDGPAGTCHIANVAQLLHRAGEPLPGVNRDAMFVFISADVPWRQELGYIDSSQTKQVDIFGTSTY